MEISYKGHLSDSHKVFMKPTINSSLQNVFFKISNSAPVNNDEV